jgi:hypothetical protein
MRGAVDIVPREFVRELERFGSSEPSSLSEAEIDSLKRRGYLTALPSEQELEQAGTVLRLLSQNFQPLVELTFHCSENIEDASGLVDELFVLAKRMAGEHGVIQTHVKISVARIDEQVMTRILDRAQTYGSTVIPQLTMAGFEALIPWLKSENFRQALLISDRENLPLAVDAVADNIINFFKQQVYLSWRCNISGMDSAQLAAVLAIVDLVRQKYPSFTTRLITDPMDQATTDNWLTIDDTFLPFISPDNESVLKTLLSFVLAPNRINYHPFFAPDAHKLSCELESKQVTYKSPSAEEVSGQFDDVRAGLENNTASPVIEMDAIMPLIQKRVSCKYALMCGCRNGMDGCSDDQQTCAALYEQRLRQVLPLLLFNLKRNSRAVASHG